jgi:lipopolysaccharide export system ATP-binding protein
MHKLKAEKLKKSFKAKEVLHGISIDVASKEVVGLLGPNGAGKTTSFYIVSGLLKATSGSVYLDNEDISKLPLHKRAQKGIGYLPQESSIFKDLSVEENLQIAAEVAIENKDKREERIESVLEALNIEPIRSRRGINLSGGERRRTEIARALIKNPLFLLLDEPFAGVDPLAVSEIQELIKELTEIGIGVLITDHNVREMLSICDRGYVIKEGSILASGTSEEIESNPLVREHYLGEHFRL